jgi:hypothetical protein
MANASKNIPGYTGFVPFKSEFFGKTVCASNRNAEHIYRYRESSPKIGTIVNELTTNAVKGRSNSINPERLTAMQKLALSTRSRDSVTWVNGPTHEIRNQCLPGYTGFIPGVKSEN